MLQAPSGFTDLLAAKGKAGMQTERGQKEISAAKVREVEAELSGAQHSLKAERLLLQQASTTCCMFLSTCNAVCCFLVSEALWGSSGV